jgi:hypothetical protein
MRETALTYVETGSPRHPAEGDGWYLYGITRAGTPGRLQLPGLGAMSHDDGLTTLERGKLAAIVKAVPLDEFSDDALQARLQDMASLEAIVRDHNAVIAAIHQMTPILPAKFGGVYARAEHLLDALDERHDALVAQLDRIDGCDEWAIHVYADRPAFQQQVAVDQSDLINLQHEIRTARPGRAYFLQRKLADALAAATERALDQAAQTTFDRFARCSVAAHADPPLERGAGHTGETEILRAAFLVRREDFEPFAAEIDDAAARQPALRCEATGPWPPYSFATPWKDESP